MTDNALSEFANALQSFQSFLIMSHTNPDLDAFGSILGLSHGLEGLGKEVSLVVEGGRERSLEFLPGSSKIEKEIPSKKYDAVIICDCGDFKRIGDSFLEPVREYENIFNIDHHQGNSHFGRWNYVVTDIASTSQLVHQLLEVMNIKLSREIATCLYAGIYGDTRSFQVSFVNADLFQFAAKLCDAGVDPVEISRDIDGNKSVGALRVQAEILQEMKFSANQRVVHAFLKEELLKKYNTEYGEVHDLVNILLNISGVQVAILGREAGEYNRFSFRSTGVNISSVCQSYGGGGHKQAAAFRTKKNAEELWPELLAKVEALFL